MVNASCSNDPPYYDCGRLIGTALMYLVCLCAYFVHVLILYVLCITENGSATKMFGVRLTSEIIDRVFPIIVYLGQTESEFSITSVSYWLEHVGHGS